MKQKLINAFWTSLLLSVVVTITTFILPRFIFQSYYAANIIEGIKIALLTFLVVFVIAFFVFFIGYYVNEHNAKKAQKDRKRKKKERAHRI